jgi:hypothetical protein
LENTQEPIGTITGGNSRPRRRKFRAHEQYLKETQGFQPGEETNSGLSSSN